MPGYSPARGSTGPSPFHHVSKTVTGTVRLWRVRRYFCSIDSADVLGNVAAFEVVVDLVVADAELVLVGAAGLVVQQVGGGDLLPHACRGAELGQQGPVLALVQAEQRQDVRAAVAELGEEARHGLGAVVRADHQVVVFAGQRVLGDHAGAGLGVALVEVGDLGAGGLLELVLEAVHGRGDVEGPLGLGFDEVQGGLGVVLVVLDAVGQADGYEVCVHALGLELLHRQLGQSAGQRGIEAAGNAQDKALGACRLQVILQESDALADLLCGVDPGLDAHFFNDLGLEFAHVVHTSQRRQPCSSNRTGPVPLNWNP